MNIIKKSSLFALALLMILASCRDDVIDVDTTQHRPDPTIITGYNPDVKPLKSSVTGHVTNDKNEYIENAVVTLGSLTTTTNEYGHFFFKGVEMNENGTFVQIEKQGYFKGSRRFYPVVDHVANISIELMEKAFSASFPSSAGGLVNVEKGGTIEFPANAIVDENNQAYDGEVRVASRWLDPTALATRDQMPGDLYAVNELNEEVVLATFGMMAVELETPTGSSLNVAENASATLTFPVPTDILGQAPSEIPLWYFNDRYGVWAQDGKATLQGNEYVGNVNHFTFWNCDVPFDYINLDFTLVDDDNNPLPNHNLTLTVNGTNSASSSTDNTGFASGKVPANETLVLKVYSNCNDVLLVQNIGPFAANESLGNIVVPAAGTPVITTLTGNLLDCDGNPVTDGVVIAEFNGRNEFYYTDGTPFTFTFTTCVSTTDVNITGVDFNNPGHTSEDVIPSGTTTDLSDIDVCNVSGPENTITVTVDGVQYIYSNATADVGHVDSIGTYIQSNLGNDIYIGFSFQSIMAGTHNGWFEVITQTALGWDLRSNGPSTFEVTELGPNPGDKIIGSYSGTLFGGSGASAVSLTFDITRE